MSTHPTMIDTLFNGAKVVMSEQRLAIDTPIQIHGVVDQVFELNNGLLLVSDLKTRRNRTVTQADVFQLSCYAFMLSAQGHTVASAGLIRFGSGSGKDYREQLELVQLLPYSEVIDTYDDYRMLSSLVHSGDGTPRCVCGYHK